MQWISFIIVTEIEQYYTVAVYCFQPVQKFKVKVCFIS